MGFGKTVTIGVVLISLCFLIVSSITFEVANKYGVPVNDKYKEMFNKYDETAELFGTTQEIVAGGDINPEGQAEGVFVNTISAGKQMMNSGNLLVSMIGEIPEIIVIPSFIISMFSFIILALGIFSFIKFVNDREP